LLPDFVVSNRFVPAAGPYSAEYVYVRTLNSWMFVMEDKVANALAVIRCLSGPSMISPYVGRDPRPTERTDHGGHLTLWRGGKKLLPVVLGGSLG